jgi:PTS system N-acetylglucosamine-specific IIC component
MFGLPGACLAMYRTARSERRAAVAGLLISLALTSFLTGVTEPVEFTFMFLAPILYALHAVATGISMAVMDMLGIRLGFSFSAGLFDYILNFNHAQRPLWLVPIGALYFAMYYVVFRWCIVRFNLSTPGREPDDVSTSAAAPVPSQPGDVAIAFVEALGGARNLREVEACTTRLRLSVVDNNAVDEAALKRLGARGFVRPSPGSLQVVLGPMADQVAGDIRNALRAQPKATPAAATAAHRPVPASASAKSFDVSALLEGLGGRDNVLDLAAVPGRLLLKLARTDNVDDGALEALGVRGIARTGNNSLHLLVAGPVESTEAPLRALLARN